MRSSALHPFLDFPALLATFARLGLLTLTVLAFNLIGDGLRDTLDPRLHD